MVAPGFHRDEPAELPNWALTMQAAAIADRMVSAVVQHSGYTPVSGDLSQETLTEALGPFTKLLAALLAERELRPKFDHIGDKDLAAAVGRTDAALGALA